MIIRTLPFFFTAFWGDDGTYEVFDPQIFIGINPCGLDEARPQALFQITNLMHNSFIL